VVRARLGVLALVETAFDREEGAGLEHGRLRDGLASEFHGDGPLEGRSVAMVNGPYVDQFGFAGIGLFQDAGRTQGPDLKFKRVFHGVLVEALESAAGWAISPGDGISSVEFVGAGGVVNTSGGGPADGSREDGSSDG
jgi:hypothetical protein